MNIQGFSMMKIGASRSNSMKSFFDMNVVPQFYAPPAQVGSVPSSVSSGMIDPNSIVPGLGFGAENLPKPPSMEDTMQLLQMYQNQNSQSDNYLNSVGNEAMAKKEEVFQSYHYQYNDSGSPVLDEKTGKPKVFEGGEDFVGKMKRLQWENSVLNDLDEKHAKEFQTFDQNASNIMNEFQNNPGSVFDTKLSKKRSDTIDNLQKQEKLMYVSHKQEKLQEIMGHLPNPDKPNEKMSNFLDQGFAKYGELAAKDEIAIENSELGQKFSNYFESVSQFIENQQKIWSSYNMQSFDPNAMKNFASQMGMRKV